MLSELTHLITQFGYIGILLVIFIQTGLLLGFFFPGDSLLFTAGFLASQGYFHIVPLTIGVTIVAILGYATSYWIGKLLGAWLMNRPDRWWFKKSYIHEAHAFYQKHGGKALVIGRLIPVIRTFVPVVAGMASMNYKRYLVYNCIGGIIWASGVTLLGFYLGRSIPGVQHYILPAVIVVVIVSVLPGVWHWYKKVK